MREGPTHTIAAFASAGYGEDDEASSSSFRVGMRNVEEDGVSIFKLRALPSPLLLSACV